MKKREIILRIRPCNMANFSGGYGYMPVWAIIGTLVSIPVLLLLWTGFAFSLKKDDGTFDYPVLKRRLHHILLPICIVLFISWLILLLNTLYGSKLAYGIATLWGAAIPTIGIYCSIYFSARFLNAKGILSKKKWFQWTLIFTAILVVIGGIVLVLLTGLGDFLDSFSRNLT